MFKLNVNRTFKAPVPITIQTADGEEVNASFFATFEVLSRKKSKQNLDKTLLEVTLKELHDIELVGDDGEILTGDELLDEARADPSLSSALLLAYWDNVAKKPKSKT